MTEGGEQTPCYVLGLPEIDPTQIALAGGKGAQLGALSRIPGVRVPRGFCVTTAAFRKIMALTPSIDALLDRLSRLAADEREPIRALSAAARGAVEATSIPDDLAAEIVRSLAELGADEAYAVRSSATAEDSPSASFAGQHDTYLNVVGPAAVLQHVRRCWASLFTERAVSYRLRNGFDHRKVQMAVVVQQLVSPRAAGILFTAEPVTSNRKVISIEAVYGLGEALVSGLVNADVYEVQGGAVTARTVAAKQLAVHPSEAGGTTVQPLAPAQQTQQALTDPQILRLAALARRIEAHFGRPQDLEWCLLDDAFQIVQSRPITTLFPVPARADLENHVYVSVGHQQMMTDAMRPLGISLFQRSAGRPMVEAGGRLFVDVTEILSSPPSREGLLALLGRSEPLTGDALRTLVERGDSLRTLSAPEGGGTPAGAAPAPIDPDPALVAELVAHAQASIATLEREIHGKSGLALLDFILTDLEELRSVLFDRRSHRVIMAAMHATWWLNDHLEAWLGQKNAADALAQSAPHNVTSEMGLALLDVADAIRPHPEVVAFLQEPHGDDLLRALGELPGGREARDALQGWLSAYGMRCVGEIDITRPRWSERPALLVPLLLGHLKRFEAGERERRFARGREEARNKAQEILARVRALPDGQRKAEETAHAIDLLRTFIGYREYPKYAQVSRYFVYKQALLGEAQRLVQAQVLEREEDIFYLTLDELREVVRTRQVDPALIRKRKDDFRAHEALTPPRVLTSDGEVVVGSYRRDDVPEHALSGLAVSSGTVEGRARVILDPEAADLEPGEILVTRFTDPSWTPLFVAIEGLVTEVGGLMTHGAVIAREYGLPAVVGVEGATRLIRDGQRIRVHGTHGYVELLPDSGQLAER